MNVSENLAYLFNGIHRGLTLLEEETYIFQALSLQGIRPSYQSVSKDIDDSAYVARWPENKFPLKIHASADYGYLFTPLELKQIYQIVQAGAERIQGVDPEKFQFIFVPERHQADIIIKYRRIDSSMYSHCAPEIGRERQITRAEVVLHIPSRNMSHSRVLLDVVHNLLHAMGVSGHSGYTSDTGAREWTPQQQVLTARDIKTLQLLYRCPLALTKRELMTLWEEYQKKHLSLPIGADLDALISNLDLKEPTIMAGNLVNRNNDISQREIALQASFQRCLMEFKTA